MTDQSSQAVSVTFDVKPGQVWIDPREVAWYVHSIVGDIVHLERTVTDQRHIRDLVRVCRQPNDRLATDESQLGNDNA